MATRSKLQQVQDLIASGVSPETAAKCVYGVAEGEGAAVAAPMAASAAPAAHASNPVPLKREGRGKLTFSRGKDKRPGFIPSALIKQVDETGKPATTAKGAITVTPIGNGVYNARGWWGDQVVCR